MLIKPDLSLETEFRLETPDTKPVKQTVVWLSCYYLFPVPHAL